MIRALLATSLLLAACGDRSNALSAPSPSPAAGFAGVVLPEIDRRDQQVNPVAMPVRADPDVPAGHKRIWSETGGWSLDIPSEWVAEKGVLRGADIYLREPAPGERGSAMPDAVGAGRVSVTLAYDHDAIGLGAFAARWAPNGSGPITERATLTVGGQRAETLRLEPNMGPPGTFTAHRHWLVSTPHFSDRYVAVNAWPADGPHRGAVERVVRSLRVFPPVSGPSVFRDRATVIAEATTPNGKALPIARAEAKLVRYAELERHLGGRSAVTDPDTPVWVVVLTGDLSHFAAMQRGPAGRASTPPPAHVILTSEARTGQGLMYGSSREPSPGWWDALQDRAP